MQDIDDFDPLDDILLSDDELPDSKAKTKSAQSLFQKSKETKTEEQTKEQKKKKMLAELFGTDNIDVSKNLTEAPLATKKSEWLELKNDDAKITTAESNLSKSVTWHSPIETNDFYAFKEIPSPIPNSNNIFNFDTTGVTVDSLEIAQPFNQKENSVSQINILDNLDRRKSEGSNTVFDLKKTKQRFKSLDLDLDLDFNNADDSNKSATNHIGDREILRKNEIIMPKSADAVRKSSLFESVTKDIDTESAYVPSTSSNRRIGVSKTKSSQPNNIFSPLATNNGAKVNSENIKDSLPSWLEPKITEAPVSSFAETPQPRHLKIDENLLANIKQQDSSTIDNRIISDANRPVDSALSLSVSDLQKRKNELKVIAKNQVNDLTKNEQEIQQSAVELMRQHHQNINTLMEIISPSSDLHKELVVEEEVSKKVENLENIIVQLQSKLLQQELENAEFKIKLKHTENKCTMDLAMVEDLCNYKLQMNEEREIRLKKEMQDLEEEYKLKIQKQKENEEEVIRSCEKKIRNMQEEHLNEVKYIIERQQVRGSLKIFQSEMTIDKDTNPDSELVAKEIILEDKHKELLEFEEQLNKQRINLEGKKAALEARIEEFETKNTKERIGVEQQKKDLKLAQTMFEEKETSWERDKQREKEYLSNYKQELEIMKETLLKEEKKIMKEKFELATEKARLEAILTLEGTNHVSDILQSKAEVQASLEEVNKVKAKLETERNEQKKEEHRLKEERWKLKEIEQQFVLQKKHLQKIFQESEMKREEGIQALNKAQKIENQMNKKMEDIESGLLELSKKEQQLTKEKIEISKERDHLNKQKYQLDMFLPQLTYEEQLPFNILNKNVVDPRIMFLKLKAENETGSLFMH